jgi:hypothetical protein
MDWTDLAENREQEWRALGNRAMNFIDCILLCMLVFNYYFITVSTMSNEILLN